MRYPVAMLDRYVKLAQEEQASASRQFRYGVSSPPKIPTPKQNYTKPNVPADTAKPHLSVAQNLTPPPVL